MTASAFRIKNKAAAKVTPSQVREIREKYATGQYTQADLCREYPLSIVQMGRIVRNEVWKDLSATALTPEQIALSGQRMWEEQERVRALGLIEQPPDKNAGDPTPMKTKLSEEIAKRAAAFGAVDRLVEELKQDSPAIPRSPLDE